MKRIHRDFDTLAGAHSADLILLEVRRDPNFFRYQGEQILSGLNVLSGFDRLLSHPT